MTRVAELRTWVTNGSYHEIIAGSYTQRNEQDGVLAEVGNAGSYYSESATTVFEDAEDKVVKTFNRFAAKLESAMGSFSSTD